MLSSTSPHLTNKILSTDLDVKNTFLEEERNDIIEIYSSGDIKLGKINITKEELENRLEDVMKIIKIGEKYEIKGEDYDMKITPINEQESQSNLVDFTKCEEILRSVYNISEEILTILKIEIDKKDEKAITNQIEYAIYDEKKKKIKFITL